MGTTEQKREFVEEVVSRLTRYFGTKKEACDFLGRTQSYMNMISRGTKDPNDKLLAMIREKTGYDYYKPETLNADPADFITQKSDALPLDNYHIMRVPLVGQLAYAGYSRGFADDEYIESLPKVPFYVETEYKGNYLAFEVVGESMFDGSYESIMQGDRVLAREIQRHLWRDKLHYKKWPFVIVHQTEGILIKRIIDHDVERGIITIHSLNPEYEDQEVFLDDVAQLFNVVRVERRL